MPIKKLIVSWFTFFAEQKRKASLTVHRALLTNSERITNNQEGFTLISRRERGFTLIEILIAMTIIALVAIMGIPNIKKLNSNKQLSNDTIELIRVLRLAQSNGMSGITCQSQPNSILDSWSFRIDSSKYEVYCWYLDASNQATKETTPKITKTLTGGSTTLVSTSCLYGVGNIAEIIFKRNNISIRCWQTPSAFTTLLPPFQIIMQNLGSSPTQQTVTLNQGGTIQ